METQIPNVSISDIEHLAWATRKKIVEQEVCIETVFGFEAEPTADQLRTLHNLLKNGGPLSVTFRSPKLQMEMELKDISEKKADSEQGSRED